MILSSNNPQINGLYEIRNLLSAEEAERILNVIDAAEWCPEGFDRRNRVQRYSGNDIEENFGWVFDKIVSSLPLSSSSPPPNDQQNNGDDQVISLRRPLEVVITEHTLSSCQSTVNIFEEREFCSCRQQQNEKCDCYVAHLTFINDAICSIEKPMRRDLECWDLVEPPDQHSRHFLMGKNCAVIKMGECLWEWRGRISNINDTISGDSEENSTKGWKKGQQKLKAFNKRCVTLTFRGILPPEPSSLSEMIEESSMTTEEAMLQLPLAKLLTIIITTSPIRSNPSTEMLERTFNTFHFGGNEFAYDCPKVIVCDGCRILADDTGENTDSDEKKDDEPPKITRKYANVKQTLRNGIATVEQAKNYAEFKKRLRKLCTDSENTRGVFSNTSVVELNERHGYGFALRHALYNCVETPYVCVIQHDRTFMRATPIREVVDAMKRRQEIKYVGMSMKSNLTYYDIFSSKFSRRAVNEFRTMIIRPEELNIGGNMYGPNGQSIANMVEPPSELRRQLRDAARVTYKQSHQNINYDEWLQSISCQRVNQNGFHQLSLTPTLFWYDNTHIVRTSHYREFIFNPVFRMVARGGFVEDKVSPVIKQSCERLGLKDGHAKFGCYLLDDHSGDVFTGHLDGGSYNTSSLHVKRNTGERRLEM